MNSNFRPFADTYRTLVWKIMRDGLSQKNARTGTLVKTLSHATSFGIDLNNGRLPMIDLRKTYPSVAAAEVAWFISGTKDATWLQQHAKIWNLFCEDDGVTVENAYGYRWRKHFGRDQLTMAIKALQADESTRQVYISTWDPAIDGLGQKGKTVKNIPCPVGFTLSIVEKRLNCALLIRSSDVFVGLPYDVMGQAMLMALIANTLKIGMGNLHVTLAHPHIYENHFDLAKEGLRQMFTTPTVWLAKVGSHFMKDGFVKHYKDQEVYFDPTFYNPKVDIVL